MSSYIRAGSEFRVNTTTARSQAQSSVTRLANGNVLVAWIDADFSTSANRFIRAQVYQSDGTPIGTEVTLASGSIGIRPNVTALPNGGFVLIDEPLGNITARVFDANAVQQGASISLVPNATASSIGSAETVTLTNGGFAVVWQDSRTTGSDVSGTGIRVSTFDQNGVAVTSNVLVNSITSGNQYNASITALAGGGYVVTWSSSTGLRGQIFDGANGKVGSEFLITSATGVDSSTTTLANGNFVVGWYDNQNHNVQIFTPAGVAVGAPISVAADF
jgi:hypothetical protein